MAAHKSPSCITHQFRQFLTYDGSDDEYWSTSYQAPFQTILNAPHSCEYEALDPTTSSLSCRCVKSEYPLNVVTLHGQMKVKMLKHADTSWTKALQHFKLFPGSPIRPETAFHRDVLAIYRRVSLDCHANPYSFVKCIQRRSVSGRVISEADIYEQFLEAAQMFNYISEQLDIGNPHVESALRHECPSCTGDMISTSTLTVDACFSAKQLKRMQSPNNNIEPLSKDTYFLKDLDPEVVQSGTKITQVCNTRAGGEESGRFKKHLASARSAFSSELAVFPPKVHTQSFGGDHYITLMNKIEP